MSVLHLSVLWYILAIEKKTNHQHPRREGGWGKSLVLPLLQQEMP